MKLRPEQVKVVVVGDAGTGKTNMINTFLSGCSCNSVPRQLRPLTVPGGINGLLVPMMIIDTDPTRQPDEMKLWVRAADVVVIVAASHVKGSIKRAETFWLPLLRDCRAKGPVVIALATESQDGPHNCLQHLYDKRKVAGIISFSVLKPRSIYQVFVCAERAAIFPVGPLARLEAETPVLTLRFRQALHRVFLCFDKDLDGRLSKAELNALQQEGFCGDSLTDSELERLTGITWHKGEDPSGLPMAGFTLLLSSLIQHRREQSVWELLERVGYTRQLFIDQQYATHSIFGVRPASAPAIETQQASFTNAGLQFLQDLYSRHSGMDGFLEQAFAACAEAPPWPFSHLSSSLSSPPPPSPSSPSPSLSSSAAGPLRRSQWVTWWRTMAMLSPAWTSRALVACGYPCVHPDDNNQPVPALALGPCASRVTGAFPCTYVVVLSAQTSHDQERSSYRSLLAAITAATDTIIAEGPCTQHSIDGTTIAHTISGGNNSNSNPSGSSSTRTSTAAGIGTSANTTTTTTTSTPTPTAPTSTTSSPPATGSSGSSSSIPSSTNSGCSCGSGISTGSRNESSTENWQPAPIRAVLLASPETRVKPAEKKKKELRESAKELPPNACIVAVKHLTVRTGGKKGKTANGSHLAWSHDIADSADIARARVVCLIASPNDKEATETLEDIAADLPASTLCVVLQPTQAPGTSPQVSSAMVAGRHVAVVRCSSEMAQSDEAKEFLQQICTLRLSRSWRSSWWTLPIAMALGVAGAAIAVGGDLTAVKRLLGPK